MNRDHALLEQAERMMDEHLARCPVCREDLERFCERGAELVLEVSQRLVSEIKARQRGDREPAATAAA